MEKPEEKKPEVAVKKINPRIVVLVSVLAVLVLGGGGAAYFLASKNAEETPEATPTAVTSASPTVAATTSIKIVDEGITWQKAVKQADLNLFTKAANAQDDPGMYDSTDYYLVGKTSTGGEIYVAVVRTGMNGYYIQRLIKRSGVYYLLTNNSQTPDYNVFEPSPTVQRDESFIIKSLKAEEVISKGLTNLVYQNNVGIVQGTEKGKSTKITETKWGDLYLFKNSEETGKGITVAYYYILLNDSTRHVYDVKPTFLRDDGSFDVTWSNSKGNNVVFQRMRTGGCGLGVGTIPIMTTEPTWAASNTIATKGSSKLYAYSDVANVINVSSYDFYKVGHETDLKTINEFVTDLGVIMWTNDYGVSVLYSNSGYLPLAECGKPVVYLYPEKAMNVSVKVGAKVTKSEPDYLNGWKVFAKPNGELTLNGKTYGSLFWEGLGYGEYPAINKGTIVKRADVESTINKQLSYIGLNQTEIKDFKEFWMPRMTDKPYVRLTWFQNEEMDALAPLSISPKPTSTIRVFLDFAGSDYPINIPKQELTKYQRNGFTAVEWGGLLK